MNVLVIGAGRAGLVTAACLANGGHTVRTYDREPGKLDSIRRGEPPFFEKDLQPMLQKAVRDGLLITVDEPGEGFDESDIILVCVGTPPAEDGSIDLGQLLEAASELGSLLKSSTCRKLFVIRSTVLPGTCESFAARLSSVSGKRCPEDFGVASNPEFLRQGNGLEDFMHRNPVIIGADTDPDLALLIALYKPFSRPIKPMPVKSAEMAKYINNCLSATKISFINEAGLLCKKLGIDINDVADVLDIRVGMGNQLKAGCGFGGGCLDKDARALMALAKERGTRLEVLEHALLVNERLPAEIVGLIEGKLGDLNGRRVGILGLAFKAGTDDLRNSRSLLVIRELAIRKCLVSAFDPRAGGVPGVSRASDAQGLVDGSDAIVILTDWDEFADLDYRDKPVLDAKGVVPKSRRGKNYEGICWP